MLPSGDGGAGGDAGGVPAQAGAVRGGGPEGLVAGDLPWAVGGAGLPALAAHPAPGHQATKHHA
eukprot:404567-Hanusia_phi.AAC.1